jgi:hypothetical protein
VTAELVERVYAPGDDCGGCGDPLEPGDLAVWVENLGRCHESCCENDPQRSEAGTVGPTMRDAAL